MKTRELDETYVYFDKYGSSRDILEMLNINSRITVTEGAKKLIRNIERVPSADKKLKLVAATPKDLGFKYTPTYKELRKEAWRCFQLNTLSLWCSPLLPLVDFDLKGKFTVAHEPPRGQDENQDLFVVYSKFRPKKLATAEVTPEKRWRMERQFIFLKKTVEV